MAFILKSIGKQTNVPFHKFECDDVSDLSKIDVSNSPMGSRCYTINDGSWYALNSSKQWKIMPAWGSGGGEDIPEIGFVATEWDSEGYFINGIWYGDIIPWHGVYFYPKLVDIDMPDVTSIGASAFRGCKELALTELPSGLISIDDAGFLECEKLALTSLPSGLTKINSQTFHKCYELALTYLPDSITEIETLAFADCTKLALASLPNNLARINGHSAFANCVNIALTELPTTLVYIGDETFRGCSNMGLSSLPSGLINIGSGAFIGCSNITLTKLPSGIERLQTTFADCTNLALTSLPSSLTHIGFETFKNCINLNITEIPENVSVIGENAFYNCEKLTSIAFKGYPEYIDPTAFANCNNLTDIYVPWARDTIPTDNNAPWGATNATIHYSYFDTVALTLENREVAQGNIYNFNFSQEEEKLFNFGEAEVEYIDDCMKISSNIQGYYKVFYNQYLSNPLINYGIEVKFKTNSTGHTLINAVNTNTSSLGLYIGINADGKLRMRGDQPTSELIISDVNVADEEWHTVRLEYRDGSTISVYLDGERILNVISNINDYCVNPSLGIGLARVNLQFNCMNTNNNYLLVDYLKVSDGTTENVDIITLPNGLNADDLLYKAENQLLYLQDNTIGLTFTDCDTIEEDEYNVFMFTYTPEGAEDNTNARTIHIYKATGRAELEEKNG